MLTRRDAGSGAWLDAASTVAMAWRGRFGRAVMIETSRSGGGALASSLSHRLGFPVSSLPEAQAAAWSEHRFGAAPGGEMVFVHADWAIGGAIISGGALLRGTHGLAGQLGRLPVGGGPATVADIAGGAALLRRAAGHGVRDLSGLMASASAGAHWAAMLLDEAAGALAIAIAAVQAILDPPVIVLGGVVGTGHGFLARLEGRLAEVHPRPSLIAATQGSDALLIGAADHAAAQAGVLALTAG